MYSTSLPQHPGQPLTVPRLTHSQAAAASAVSSAHTTILRRRLPAAGGAAASTGTPSPPAGWSIVRSGCRTLCRGLLRAPGGGPAFSGKGRSVSSAPTSLLLVLCCRWYRDETKGFYCKGGTKTGAMGSRLREVVGGERTAVGIALEWMCWDHDAMITMHAARRCSPTHLASGAVGRRA